MYVFCIALFMEMLTLTILKTVIDFVNMDAAQWLSWLFTYETLRWGLNDAWQMRKNALYQGEL